MVPTFVHNIQLDICYQAQIKLHRVQSGARLPLHVDGAS